MKTGVVVVAIFCATAALATVRIAASIEQLAEGADHILVGHVIGVDMVDERGRPVTDERGRTGPGLKNTIRLHVMVDEVLVTSSRKAVPKVLKVPLDPMMHFTLGQIRRAHTTRSTPYLVLLKGSDFAPVVRGNFLRGMNEKETALSVHARTHPKSSTPRR